MSGLNKIKEKLSSSSDTIDYQKLYEEEVLKNKENTNKINSLEKENELLGNTISDLKKNNENISKRLDDNSKLLESLKSDNQELAKTVNASLETSNALSKKIESIERLINDGKAVSTGIKSSLDNLSGIESSVKNIDEKVSPLDDNYSQLFSKIDSLNGVVDNFNGNFDGLNDNINDIIINMNQNKSQLEQVFDSNQDILLDIFNNLNSENSYEFKNMDSKLNGLDSKINGLYSKVNGLDSKVNGLNNQNQSERVISKLNGLGSKLRSFDPKYIKLLSLVREVQYAMVFNDTIRDSQWLSQKTFSLIKGASNYSFMYILYRILNEIRPANILECGLGQTTKLTTQYVNYSEGSTLTVVEDSKDWIETFSQNLKLNDNISFINSDLEEFDYEDTQGNIRYKNLKKQLPKVKFDLIIIDGPRGFKDDGLLQDYPRSNIWDLLDYVNDDFVIIMDDYDRTGEQNTFEELLNIFDQRNVKYKTLKVEGAKNQAVLCSESNEFVLWM